MAIVNNADGFTDYNSTGTIYYVDSTLGNDANAGTSQAAPLRTLLAGYNKLTTGTGAQVLLRRGQRFGANDIAWIKSGASTTDFMVLGAYGPLTDSRPIVDCGGTAGIGVTNTTVRYVAVQSVHFAVNGASYGLSFLFQGQGTSKVLDSIHVEDCRFDNFYRGMRWQTGDPTPQGVPQSPTPATNCRIVRCQFVTCNIGYYSSMLHTAEVRDNMYIGCGFNFQEHGCYFDDARYFVTKPAIQYRGNIAMGDDQGSGEGHKVRCVSELGEMKGNFSARYGIGLTAGSGGGNSAGVDAPNADGGTGSYGGGTDMNPGYQLRTNVLSNVVTEGRNMKNAAGVVMPRGQGMWLIWLSGAGSTVRYNCITDMQGGYRAGIVFSNGPSNAVTIDQNTCYGAGSSGGSALYSLQNGGTLTGIVVTTNRFRDTVTTPLIIQDVSGTFAPSTRSGNTFYSTASPSNMVVGAGTVDQYGSVVANADVGLVGVKPTITTFLTTIGVTGDYFTLRTMLVAQRRGTWDARIEGYKICDHWMRWAGYPLLSGLSGPTASTGSAQNATDTDRSGAETLTLDASGSSAVLPATITNYKWTEGASTLYDGANDSADVAFNIGTHNLSLTVTDSNGLASAALVTHTVTPNAPTGMASSAITNTGATIGCTAYTNAVSYTYQWGTTTAYTGTPITSASNSVPMTGLSALTGYHWRVRVNAPGVSGAYSADQTFTTIANPNGAPTARITPASQTVNDTDSNGTAPVSVSGTTSSDPDLDVLTYAWKVNGGSVASTSSAPTLTCPVGDNTISLTVTDPGTLTGTASVTARVVPGTPTTLASSSITQTTAIATCDAYTNATGYRWSYGQVGGTQTSVDTAVPHLDMVGLQPATTHTITVRALAGSVVGAVSNTELFVTLTPPQNVPPVADAGTDATFTDTDRDALVTATLDLSGSADSDGSIVAYTVKQSTTVLYSGSDSTPDVVVGIGLNTLAVTCTDDSGAVSNADTVVITGKPGVPTGFGNSASVAATTVSVTAYAGVTYEWQYGTTTGVYTVTVQSANPSLAITGLGASTGVFWRVRAVVPGVNGDWSAEQTATTGAADNQAPIAVQVSLLGDADNDRDGFVSFVADGTQSSDPDGTVVAWSWQINGVEIATGATPTLVLPIGTNQVDLIVTDDDDKESAPKRGEYIALPGAPIGVGSSQDASGAVLFVASYPGASAYVFEYGPTNALGTTVRSSVPSVTIPATGSVRWNCYVEAGTVGGLTCSIQQTNPIVTELHPPLANAGSDITDTDTDNTGFEDVTLDGSGSTDNGNDIVGWYWIHEGTVLSYATETYVLSAPVGITSYFLTVIDSQGSISSNSDEVQVSVTPAQVGAVAVVAGDGKLVIAWPTVNGGVTYEAQASTASDFSTVDSSSNSITNSTTLLGLVNTTDYYVRVRASKNTLNGSWSANSTGTPTARDIPDDPTSKAYKRVERFLRLVRFGRM